MASTGAMFFGWLDFHGFSYVFFFFFFPRLKKSKKNINNALNEVKSFY